MLILKKWLIFIIQIISETLTLVKYDGVLKNTKGGSPFQTPAFLSIPANRYLQGKYSRELGIHTRTYLCRYESHTLSWCPGITR